MPQVKMSGKFLGGALRQYDKGDGSGKATAGGFWLWDGDTATELRPDRDMPHAVAAALFDGFTFGDDVTVAVDMRMYKSGPSFVLMGVERPSGKAGS